MLAGRLTERFLPIALLGLSIVSVPLMMLSPTGAPRLESLRGEKQRVDVEVSRLSEQIRRLRVEVRHTKDDPAKIEQIARDELGLVRETELVLQFGN